MNDQKPCLVPAGQGFSVSYKNRYLYSKFNPMQGCERLVSTLQILPGSLIVVFSPVLGYGLQDLLQKIDSDSYVIAIETDPELFDFSLPHIKEFQKNTHFEYLYISPDKTGVSAFLNRINIIMKVDKSFFFKRLHTLNFAAVTQIENFKTDFITYTDSFIDFFWKNRITLTKMGRLYARNIFKNLHSIHSSVQLQKGSIQKPIIVLGAGISLESIIPFLKLHAQDFFIICVDSALFPLLEHGISPQIVQAVECQLANMKAFIGTKNSRIHLDTDLSSRPRVKNISAGEVSFFLSEYESSHFLSRLKKAIPVRVIPPLGSVGLTAVQTALYLRSSEVPIFFAGLDFSYIPGKTHCKSAPAHRSTLITSNRLTSTNSNSGYFSKGTEFLSNNTITDAPLKRYALLFDEEFSSCNKLYNLSITSLIKKVPFINLDSIQSYYKQVDNTLNPLSFFSPVDNSIKIRVENLLKHEKENLLTIKDALMYGSLKEEKLLNLLEQHEYLYLHFPDGYKKPNLSQSFLKRIRAEIDFFLKDIDGA